MVNAPDCRSGDCGFDPRHLRVNTNTVGNVAEAQILAALLRNGKRVLLPFGDGSRYDMVIDEGDRFVRVQCKNGRLRNGCVLFNTCSNYRDGTSSHYTSDEIDAYGVYCPETGAVYFVPMTEKVAKGAASLRVDPYRSTNQYPVLWAKDFELT